MTSTESFPVDAVGSAHATGHRPKSVLFCPDCGHESPVGGDWDEDERARVRCPVCQTVVSGQQASPGPR